MSVSPYSSVVVVPTLTRKGGVEVGRGARGIGVTPVNASLHREALLPVAVATGKRLARGRQRVTVLDLTAMLTAVNAVGVGENRLRDVAAVVKAVGDARVGVIAHK